MVFLLATYYESICAIIGYYLVESFRDPLPWAHCRPQWGDNCWDSAPMKHTEQSNASSQVMGVTELTLGITNSTDTWQGFERTTNRTISSSELFFV